MANKAATSTQTQFVDAKNPIFARDGALWTKNGAIETKIAPPQRALPLSAPDEWILLSSEEGDEIGMIRRIGDLDEKSQQVVRTALDAAYQTTIITRILDVEREPMSGQIVWRVEIVANDEEDNQNDSSIEGKRGLKALFSRDSSEEEIISAREISFRIAGDEDIQTARYPQIYFSDLDGNRLEIPNCEALDLGSRRASERYF